MQKPSSPKQYIVGQLEKIKVAGTRPALTAEDLKHMFSMFEVTKGGAGTVTQQQASNALRTVLGQRAPQAPAGAAGTAMCLQEFVDFMQTSLQAATPLCKATGAGSCDDEGGSD